MLLQILLQLMIPPLFIFVMWRAKPVSSLRWFLDSLTLFLVIIFLGIVARWDMTSYYLRFIYPILFLVASYSAYRRIEPADTEKPKGGLVENAFSITLIVIFGALNLLALRGYLAPSETVDLAYPLRGGRYYVGGGGASRWINNHNAVPPQDYALDITDLNGLGRGASFGGGSDLERYTIFGDPIYSPCTGTVIRAVDRHPDQIPPETDRINLAGNHVLIACHDVEVLLAHIKEGSVAVERGDEVGEGDILGQVGNSGNTSQPHLHIHAERDGLPGQILDGVGVAITFGGRFLVRNSLFSGQ